jgi:PAS domain S-box-containing protein
MPSDPPSIVIVDDASEVRLLVRTRLRLSGGLTVLGEGADGAEAVALAAEHRPDLMLLDVSMPGMDGLTALPRVLEASPGTRVVLYSGFEEHGLAERGAALGAAAFIEKSTPVDSLIDLLLEVHDRERRAHRSDAPVTPLGPRHVAGAPSDRAGDQAVLDEHLERFREVFHEAAIGMATMTLAGTVVRANSALATLTERPTETLVGSFYGDVTDGRGAEVAAALDEVREHQVNVLHLEHGVAGASDGRVLQATLAPVRDSGGRPLYLFLQVQDVTEERRALEELRRSEQRFRLLVEAVAEYAIFMLSPAGVIVSWNAGAQRSKGYAAEEIIGQHFRVFYPPELQAARHPERELELALKNGQYEEEGWRVRKDGSTFWALVVITAVFDDDGQHIGFAKVTRDQTEQRQYADDRVEAMGEQARLLAVTAHELRNPTAVIDGSAHALQVSESRMTPPERDQFFRGIRSSADRLRRLAADLATTSQLQGAGMQFHTGTVALPDLVRGTADRLMSASPAVRVDVDVPHEAVVHADEVRLSQALDNLVDNAVRHGAPPVAMAARLTGGHVEVRVTDAGAGVPVELVPRLFDRFAAAGATSGAGLGLYLVREIARGHAGEAAYEPPVEGSPTTFLIRFPVGAASP